MLLLIEQQAEIDKYSRVYQRESYRMGGARKAYAEENLRTALERCSTYLDVGCGRGEMVGYAKEIGYRSMGVEAVDYLAEGEHIIQATAWDLPFDDNEFDLVTLFDVIEHILPADTLRTLAEIGRVARKELFITAANYSSKSTGVELHVNRLPYPEWDSIMRGAFSGVITWMPRKHGIQSETWHIQLSG